MQSHREKVTMETEAMGDSLNSWRCSRQRRCVKLPVKFPSSPGLHGVASASAYRMSQFHTNKFQEPALSLGACDFKTLEIYLYCVYPLHFHVRETCQQFAMGIGRRDGGSELERLENHLPSSSA